MININDIQKRYFNKNSTQSTQIFDQTKKDLFSNVFDVSEFILFEKPENKYKHEILDDILNATSSFGDY